MSSTRHSISARLPPHQLSCRNFRQSPTDREASKLTTTNHQLRKDARSGKSKHMARRRAGGRTDLVDNSPCCSHRQDALAPIASDDVSTARNHPVHPLTRMNTRMPITVSRMRRCIPHPPTTFHSTRSWADGWKGIVECGMRRINRSDPSISKMGERRRRYNGIAEL